IAIFAAVILGSLLFMKDSAFSEFRYVLAGLTLIFFTGLKDDLVDLGWLKKIVAEVFAAILVVVVAGIRINTFHGLFGVNELPGWFSIGFSVFVCVALINCFNLLDGIDGLASGMAIFISVIFGIWLYKLGYSNFALLAFALTGGLIPFFFYNVFGKKNKLFMGDSGSLMLGFLFSVLAMKILCCEIAPGNSLYMNALPVVVMSVMIIPMFDTIRVFTLRIIKGKSPFVPDRTHLHHVFLKLGFNHLQTSGIIIMINIGLAVMTFLLRDLDPFLMLVILFGTAFAICLIPCYMESKTFRTKRKSHIVTPVH
ncbi:MAG: MraY family glycosyltransferase, partial [Bacteroidota bacterium]